MYNKKYYEDNKEKFKEYNKKYYEKNKNKIKKRHKKHYEKNKEKTYKKQKEWIENNKQRFIQLTSESRKRRVEKLRKEGCTNAWCVVTKGAVPKYKKEDI